jgi:hypothetical protein
MILTRSEALDYSFDIIKNIDSYNYIFGFNKIQKINHKIQKSLKLSVDNVDIDLSIKVKTNDDFFSQLPHTIYIWYFIDNTVHFKCPVFKTLDEANIYLEKIQKQKIIKDILD